MPILLYVYGIARVRPGQMSEGPVLFDAHPVRAIIHDDVAAIVAPVPETEFSQEALGVRLQDPAWVASRALEHQRVLAALQARHTVVPCRFCTLYRSEDGIRAMLAGHHDHLRGVLARVAGAAEWGVKVYCQRPALEQWVAAHLDQRIGAGGRTGEGAAYLLARRRETVLHREAQGLVEACAQESHARLTARARAAAVSAMAPPLAEEREAELVHSGAYLVDDVERASFDEVLTALAETYGPRGFRFASSGPWPPYHFADLALERSHESAGVSP